jgi:hypothetical protein
MGRISFASAAELAAAVRNTAAESAIFALMSMVLLLSAVPWGPMVQQVGPALFDDEVGAKREMDFLMMISFD